MFSFLAITKRELRSQLVTPLAYVAGGAMVFLSGFFFFTQLQYFLSLQKKFFNQEIPVSITTGVIFPYYMVMSLMIVFFAPLLTLRGINEERRQGTLELLITSRASLLGIVFGKYLGLLIIAELVLLICLIHPLMLAVYSQPDLGVILMGYLGLCVQMAAFMAVGLGVSAFCRSQAVSGLVTLIILLAIYLLDTPVTQFQSSIGNLGMLFFRYLSAVNHFEMLARGYLDFSDLFYFISLIVLGLASAVKGIELLRWRVS